MTKELSVYSLVNGLIQFKVLDSVVKLVQLSNNLGLDPFPGGAIVRSTFDHFSYTKRRVLVIVVGPLSGECRCER
jgi:hypothetical protein